MKYSVADPDPYVFGPPVSGSRSESLSTRVSFETSFDSKQPKLEPKQVSALSETKRLFRLFRFYTETEFRCFDLTETNRRPTETV